MPNLSTSGRVGATWFLTTSPLITEDNAVVIADKIRAALDSKDSDLMSWCGTTSDDFFGIVICWYPGRVAKNVMDYPGYAQSWLTKQVDSIENRMSESRKANTIEAQERVDLSM